ncbi:MAG: glycine--tRNA ligase subunit beta, partial [Gammaproteobacteria bacterium]|nr:glycine--tRNA ligase subunit beta [Gammaproteobacteria bacterium]
MTDTRTLLVEIGTEELPPKALAKLALAFEDALAKEFDAVYGAGGPANTKNYFSPRRLAVLKEALPVKLEDQTQRRLGPAVAAAFKDGKPTKAAEGFAASCGLSVDELEREQTDKGERLAATVTVSGKNTVELLPGMVANALKRLPIPKRMRWSDKEYEFIRPVHWVVMLFGEELVECEILGKQSGRITYGHRFHAPAPVELSAATDYPDKLAEHGKIKLNRCDGKKGINHLAEDIRKIVKAEAAKLKG